MKNKIKASLDSFLVYSEENVSFFILMPVILSGFALFLLILEVFGLFVLTASTYFILVGFSCFLMFLNSIVKVRHTLPEELIDKSSFKGVTIKGKWYSQLVYYSKI